MALDLAASLRRAEQRLPSASGPARHRKDRGRSRLTPAVREELEGLLSGQERPSVRAILDDLGTWCEALGEKTPARATVYQAMARFPSGTYPIGELPAQVRIALYNLDPDGTVPGHQLAFYCLNYGDLSAMSFAAGLPWLSLYQAADLPGWRRRSRGLLEAIRRVRRI